MPNPLWLQAVTTACPALLIGLLAWFVSRGQLLVAKEKLRHDLFERRFAIFYAFQNYLLAVAMGKGTEELSAEVVAKLATARFLFDQKQFEYLKLTFQETATLHNMCALFDDETAWNTPKERVEARMKHINNCHALFEKINEVAVKLAPKLRLRDFGPRQA